MSEERLLREAREIADLLLSSSEHARNLFSQISGELGVPVPVARALCAMDGTAPMSELAAKLHCDKSYVTALADQLESLELVHRVPGPDRRVKMLELTSHGQSLRQRLESRIVQVSPAMNHLSAEEREVFRQLLAKVSPSQGNGCAVASERDSIGSE